MRRAFTLVEIAIVLFIVSMLLGLGLVAFTKTTLGEKYRITKSYMEKLTDILIEYASAQGHLPCPDIDCDGREDRCTKEEGCDLDDDGEVDIAARECYAAFYSRHKEHYKPPLCIVEKRENFPPYLLPFENVDAKKDDGFAKRLRYDVNYVIAATSSLQHFCEIVGFLTPHIRANSDKERKSSYYLPIVTGTQDKQDDELIENSDGSSIAALLISQGECVGVSGKNGQGNREYAKSTTPLDAKNCEDGGYDDIVKELLLAPLYQKVCQDILHPKSITITAQNGDSISLKIHHKNRWSCINAEDIGFEEPSGFVFRLTRNEPDYLLLYTQKDCSNTPLRIYDFVYGDRDSDGEVGVEEESIADSVAYLHIYAQKGLWYQKQEDDVLYCEKADAAINFINLPLDAYQNSIAWYRSKDDCQNNTHAIATLESLKDYNDTNNDNIVYIKEDGGGDNRFTKIKIYFQKDTSYFAKGECITFTRSGVATFDLDTFALLFTEPHCPFDRVETITPLYAIIEQNILNANNGRCIFTQAGAECRE